MRVFSRSENVQHIPDLGTVVVALPGNGHIRDVPGLQCILKLLKIIGIAAEDGRIVPGMHQTGLHQFRQTLSEHPPCPFAVRVICLLLNISEQKLNSRLRFRERIRFFMQSIRCLHRLIGGVIVLAAKLRVRHDLFQKPAHRCEQFRFGPVCGIQKDIPAFTGRRFSTAAVKQGDIGAAEPVDALLLIPDRKQPVMGRI